MGERLTSAFCVSIPVGACSGCRREALGIFQEQRTSRTHDQVLLQDRMEERYLRI
jgi:hypothetical protein